MNYITTRMPKQKPLKKRGGFKGGPTELEPMF